MLGKKVIYGWTDTRAAFGVSTPNPRYEIKWRYGKWIVIDTHTNTALTKVNTKELAETYLRLLGEDDGSNQA